MHRLLRDAMTLAAVLVIAACEATMGPELPDRIGLAATLAISVKSVALVVGQARQLSVLGAATRVSWQSDNPAVATVSGAGVISAQSPGITRVIVRAQSLADTTLVAVRRPVAAVQFADDSVDVVLGKTARISFRALDAGGTSLDSLPGAQVDWMSSVSSIATVDSTGLVFGQTVGRTELIVRVDGISDTAIVRVKPAAVASITLNTPSKFSISAGRSYQLTAILKDESSNEITNRTVTWATSDSTVATVSADGFVSCLVAGSAQITATSEGQTATATVIVVQQPVATISVSVASTTLNVGQTTQATGVLRDPSGNVLSSRLLNWTSLSPAIATVSTSGVVTGVSAGSATIQTTSEGKSGEATITVVGAAPASVASLGVVLGKSSVVSGQTTQAIAVAKDANGTIITGQSVVWASLNPDIATVSTSGLVISVAPGTATIRATVETKTADATLSVTATPVTPTPTTPLSPPAPSAVELPRVFLNTSLTNTPSTGRTLRVAAGDNLQRTLDSAVPGDRIVLAAGATFTGNFTFSSKTSGGNAGEWITVTSDGELPAEGTRVSPAISAQYRFPRLSSPDQNYVLSTNGPAARWRFIGVEFTNDPSVPTVNGTINLGDASAAQNTLAKVPTDLILDRVYVHSPDATDDRRCINFNSARTAIVDSYVSGCKSAFDAQAIAGTNGPGPFKIVNNYLEASGETLMWGGADPGIPNLVPSDIEIRRNHFFRPMSWRGKWLQKQIIESKNSSHVLVEANVMENSWVDGQYGWIMGLWSVNQQGGCSWCVTEHWTVRNNLIRNVSAGFSLTAKSEAPSIPAHHIVITNNLIIGLDNPAIQGYGRIFQIYGVSDLTIEHNTAFTPFNPSFSYDPAPMPNHVVRNNLVGGGQYQIFSSQGQGQLAWNGVAGPGSEFVGNVIAMFTGAPIDRNYFPETLDAVGLLGGAAAAYSVSASPTDLALGAMSPYKGKATDGTDPGANIAVIVNQTANVKQP